MVGILDDINQKMTMHFKDAGDTILLIGAQHNDIASSEYLHKLKGVQYSSAPYFNLEEEYNTQQLISKLIKGKKIKSAHDISEGGLMITLLESGFSGGKGFNVNPTIDIRQDAYWFGEAQGRIVVSVSASDLADVIAVVTAEGIAFTQLGTVTSSEVEVAGNAWGSIEEWKNKYDTAIENLIK
jgi:phosphoribosylformylglycinamidine synthase subunit PurL